MLTTNTDKTTRRFAFGHTPLIMLSPWHHISTKEDVR
eukprot:XP_001705965.1 Hypothetical protein GL50803_118288 [Giardia lamblia ATCC 50803]